MGVELGLEVVEQLYLVTLGIQNHGRSKPFLAGFQLSAELHPALLQISDGSPQIIDFYDGMPVSGRSIGLPRTVECDHGLTFWELHQAKRVLVETGSSQAELLPVPANSSLPVLDAYRDHRQLFEHTSPQQAVKDGVSFPPKPSRAYYNARSPPTGGSLHAW
jgi:hypothetical protein